MTDNHFTTLKFGGGYSWGKDTAKALPPSISFCLITLRV